MNVLDPGYAYEVDRIHSDLWHEWMLDFNDASFYQTWAFGSVHSGERHLSHLVLKKDGRVVAMAQARIAALPGGPLGIAYVNGGPLWRRKDEEADSGRLRNALRALFHEYVIRRKYFLRIIPNVIASPAGAPVMAVFEEEGFSHRASPDQTAVLDLSTPLEEIRRNLGRKWRQTLQSAAKKDLAIVEGADEDLCRMGQDLFRDMKDRKQFFGGDQAEALEVHKRLPEKLKLHVMVSMHTGEPVAALGCVTFGSLGLPLISATGSKGLGLNASYGLWWKMIEYYKDRGFPALDLGGISEERNPGGFYFKTHILGKGFKAPDRYLGYFDACRNPLSAAVFRGIYLVRDGYRTVGRQWAKSGRRAAKADDRAGAPADSVSKSAQ